MGYMNILLLCTHLNLGGITQYVSSLAKGLKEHSHQVFIASSGGQMVGELAKQGIQHIDIPIRTKSEISPKVILGALKLKSKLKRHEIQIIHANSRVTQVLAYYLSKFTGVPFVSTCHGFFKLRFSRRVFPCWGKRVIAISEQVRRHLVDDFRIPERDLVLIHNGLDLTRYREPDSGNKGIRKKEFGLGDGPVIGIIARLSPVKGHKFLVLAFKEVLKNNPNVQLLIVGDGPLRDELITLAKNLGIEKNVFFKPSCLDTVQYLSVMDIFVMPSIREGLGLAIIEAQAMGLPVVASCIGGINTLIEDGRSGLLVQPADYRAIGEAIILLLKDKDLSGRLAKNAKERVKENFSLELMVKKTEELYNSVLNKLNTDDRR